MDAADHVDVKSAVSGADMRRFASGMLGCTSPWVRALFWLRKYLARLFRLHHDGAHTRFTPETLPMVPGQKADFFTVILADEKSHYVLGAEDRHLSAQIALLAEPLSGGLTRYHLYTLVRFNDWTGPVYFSLIRPFHHLIVSRVVRAGANAAFPGQGVSRQTKEQ